MYRSLIRTSSLRMATLLVIAMLLLPQIHALDPASVAAQDDSLTQREFRNLVADAQEAEPVFGPEDGELEHDEESISFEGANLDIADLLVTATFSNPVAGSRHDFDLGVQFRNHREDREFVSVTLIVLNDGDWAVFEGTDDLVESGTYDDFDDSRTGENTITIYAAGETVHIGINGDYVDTVEVSVEDEGEVLIGAGFFNDTYIEDGVTEYSDFTIWELEDQDPAPGDETGDESAPGDRNEKEPGAETPDADAETGDGPGSGDRNDDLGPVVNGPATEDGERNDPIDTPVATDAPTEEPTATVAPTEEPTPTPTTEPTQEPTVTEEPTETATTVPTATEELTATSTPEPTATATTAPTEAAPPTSEARTTPISTPAEEASPDGTPIAASPVALTSYQEPQYGYSFAYDDSWTVIAERDANRRPNITLTNGVSELSIGAIGGAPLDTLSTPNEMADAIVATFADTGDVFSASVATADNGKELRGSTEDGAFVVLDVVMLFGNGDQEAFIYAFEFRQIPGQNAVLTIMHSSPAADYESEASGVAAILDSIVMAPVSATPEA